MTEKDMTSEQRLTYALQGLIDEVRQSRFKLDVREDFSLINAHAYAEKTLYTLASKGAP